MSLVLDLNWIWEHVINPSYICKVVIKSNIELIEKEQINSKYTHTFLYTTSKQYLEMGDKQKNNCRFNLHPYDHHERRMEAANKFLSVGI